MKKNDIRETLRYPKILSGLWSGYQVKSADRLLLINHKAGSKEVRITSKETLSRKELSVFMGLLALGMDRAAVKTYSVELSPSQASNYLAMGINSELPRHWMGSANQILRQSSTGKKGGAFSDLKTILDRLMGVIIEVEDKTEGILEMFPLVEYARISSRQQSAEVRLNPLLSTVLFVNLSQPGVDTKLLGYFRILQAELTKISGAGFARQIFVILCCEFLQASQKKTVTISSETLAERLHIQYRPTTVTKPAFHRQIKAAVNSVAYSMGWQVLEDGKGADRRFTIINSVKESEPIAEQPAGSNKPPQAVISSPEGAIPETEKPSVRAPFDWFKRAGFVDTVNAYKHSCNEQNWTEFKFGVPLTASANDRLFYLRSLLIGIEPGEGRENPMCCSLAFELFADLPPGLKSQFLKSAGPNTREYLVGETSNSFFNT